jgi:hypothetical protein
MKDTVQRALELDILHLQRNGFLTLAADVPWQIEWTRNGEPYSSVGYVLEKQGDLPVSIRLQYTTTNATINGDPRACDYWVAITSTSCNYGGVRLWFTCPGWKSSIACRRRCRKLYLASLPRPTAAPPTTVVNRPIALRMQVRLRTSLRIGR